MHPLIFINCHPDPPSKPPIPPPENSLVLLYIPMQGWEGVWGSLGEGVGGWEGGVAIYENPGFPVSKPRVSQSLTGEKSNIDMNSLVRMCCGHF